MVEEANGVARTRAFDELFAHGARWLRADFHLHTPSDARFDSSGPEQQMPAAWQDAWVGRLAQEEIHIGVVANHNTFDLEEFKALRERCRNQGIGLFPGMELSLRGNSGAAHILVVCDSQTWIDNRENRDFINSFLAAPLEQTANSATGDAPSGWDLETTLEELEEHRTHGRDSFVVLDHADDENGARPELGTGLSHPLKGRFSDLVFGVQKTTYLKIGEMSFLALRLAVTMGEHRITDSMPAERAGRIDSVSFTGGLLDGRSIKLSPQMTNAIGTRGSGGSVRASVAGSDGNAYTVSRVLNDFPQIYRDETVIPDTRPTSLLTLRYFGQKDLARFSERRFAHELIDRFTGGSGRENDEPIQRIQSLLLTIEHHEAALEQVDETRAELASVRESLRGFEEHRLKETLQTQINFENDLRQASQLLESQEETEEALAQWYDDYAGPYRRRVEQMTSAQLAGVRDAGGRFLGTLAEIENLVSTLQRLRGETQTAKDDLAQEYAPLRDGFADARRALTLPDNLSPDTYVALTRRETTLSAKLTELESLESKRTVARKQLDHALTALQQAWREQFQTKERSVRALNAASEGVKINLGFMEDKTSFAEQLLALAPGMQKRTAAQIAQTFSDGIEIYRDLATGGGRLSRDAGLNESQLQKLRDAVNRTTTATTAFVTFRPPDRVELSYRGKPLHEHSLGQRATALMLFLLSQEDVDVLVVDQPEDDLDNQTVYAEIVGRILENKGARQIIFATHNPNIPVLGDAEQIVRCRYAPDGIHVAQGALDDRSIQEEIVSVMEGGRDAFERRQRIYETWKQ